MYRALIILLLLAQVALGSILPSYRMGYWRDGVGVKGGIPDSSAMTVFSNLTSSATVADINAALAACPSNQVVTLAAGTYNLAGGLSGVIRIENDGVVLRGAGMSNTVLNFSGSGADAYSGISISRPSSYFYNAITGSDPPTVADVSSGYSQGSSNLVLSATTGLAVGMLLTMDELNDASIVNGGGYQEDYPSVGRGANNTRILEQTFEVKAINGTTVTVWPPVHAPFWASGLSPQAWWMPADHWIAKSGVEDMQINIISSKGNGATSSAVALDTARECWEKNVCSTTVRRAHFGTWAAYRCEVRHCYFFNTQLQGTTSYGVELTYTTGALVEDNILEQITGPIHLNADNVGCVIAYNYTTNNFYLNTSSLVSSIFHHAPHSYMNLEEGNHVAMMNMDFTHGSSSHSVMFRNRSVGWEPICGAGGETTGNLITENIDITNRFHSSVGNLLGTTGKHTYYESIPGNTHANNTIYRIGVASSWADDQMTVDTFFRHMDYDVVTDGITYNATNADVTLPDSLYLASKPSFFGVMPWPPYNPTNHPTWMMGTSDASYTNIPAGYRYVYGVDPPAGGGSGGTTNAILGAGIFGAGKL